MSFFSFATSIFSFAVVGHYAAAYASTDDPAKLATAIFIFGFGILIAIDGSAKRRWP